MERLHPKVFIPAVWQAVPPLLPRRHGIDWCRILLRRRSRLFVLNGITSLRIAAAVVEEEVVVVVAIAAVVVLVLVMVLCDSWITCAGWAGSGGRGRRAGGERVEFCRHRMGTGPAAGIARREESSSKSDISVQQACAEFNFRLSRGGFMVESFPPDSKLASFDSRIPEQFL